MDFISNRVTVNDGLVSINGVMIDDITDVSVLNGTVYVHRNYDIVCEIVQKRVDICILEERSDEGYLASMTSFKKSSKTKDKDFISVLKENLEEYE